MAQTSPQLVLAKESKWLQQRNIPQIKTLTLFDMLNLINVVNKSQRSRYYFFNFLGVVTCL